MKRKDRNYVGILSDQGKAATALNFSEYTIRKQIGSYFIVQSRRKRVRSDFTANSQSRIIILSLFINA